jgi:hypothetical protein
MAVIDSVDPGTWFAARSPAWPTTPAPHLRGPPHHRRTVQERDHPLPQAIHRPRALQDSDPPETQTTSAKILQKPLDDYRSIAQVVEHFHGLRGRPSATLIIFHDHGLVQRTSRQCHVIFVRSFRALAQTPYPGCRHRGGERCSACRRAGGRGIDGSWQRHAINRTPAAGEGFRQILSACGHARRSGFSGVVGVGLSRTGRRGRALARLQDHADPSVVPQPKFIYRAVLATLQNQHVADPSHTVARLLPDTHADPTTWL